MTGCTESLNYCSTDLLGALAGELQPAVPVPTCPPGACRCDARRAAPPVIEPRFTLAEAALELAARTCATEGHNLEIVNVAATVGDSASRPIALICTRACGSRGYRVLPMGSTAVSYGELLTAALIDLWADLATAYDRSLTDPRENSIECAGLITRIVDIARVVGAVPAEIVGPELIVAGLYAEVHRIAGRDFTIADCTMADARERLAERDAARGTPDVSTHGIQYSSTAVDTD